MADALPPFNDDLYGIPQDEMDEINASSEPANLAPAQDPSPVIDKKIKKYDPVKFAQGLRKTYPGRFDKYKDDYMLAKAVAQTDPRFANKIDFGPQGPEEVVNGYAEWAKQNPKTDKLNKAAEGIGETYQAVTAPLEAAPTAFDTFSTDEIPLHRRLLGAVNVPTTGLEAGAKLGRGIVGAGNAVQGAIDKVAPQPDIRDEGLTPTYAAKKTIELLSPGSQIVGAAGTLGDIVPQDRLGVLLSILGMKRPKQSFAKDGDLPLERSKSAIDPKIAEKFKDETPFRNERARQRVENQAMTDHVREKELNGILSDTANEQGAFKDQLIGDAVDFGNDAEIGASIKAEIIKRKGVVKGRLADADRFITEQAENVPAQATRASSVASELVDDLRNDLVDQAGDAGLDKILLKIRSAKTNIRLAKAPYEKPSTLADLIQAHKDLRSEMAKPSAVDAAGNFTPRGAALGKIKTALGEDIANHVSDATDRLGGATKDLKKAILADWEAKDSAKGAVAGAKQEKFLGETRLMGDADSLASSMTEAKAAVGKAVASDAKSLAAQEAFDVAKAARDAATDVRLDKVLPKMRARWKNFYDTFGKQNGTVTEILKTQDPVKIWEVVKQSEDALIKTRAATKGDVYQPIGVFKEAKAKLMTEILDGMQKLDSPEAQLDYLEGYLKDKSGKEAMTKFLSDGDRAALRGMLGQNMREFAANKELNAIGERLKAANASSAHSKRLGELASFDTRSGPKMAQTAWKVVKDQAVASYGNRSGMARIGGATLLAIMGHPILGAAVFASKLSSPLFAHLYFNNIGFRTAVNTFSAGPSSTSAANIARLGLAASKAGDNANRKK